MRVIEKEIGVGDRAVGVTVADMCRLATRDSQHPLVRALAQTLRQGRTLREAIKAAHDHVCLAVPYRSDPPGIEEVIAPIYSLGLVPPSGEGRQYWKPGGDCDDQSTALAAVLLAMGVRAGFKVIAWRVKDYTHVYVVAALPDGTVIPCDPVMGPAGFGYEKKPVIRSKVTWCMVQRTLEDNLSGCGCGGRCGGGQKPAGKCCPQNYDNRPVNVVVNTGRIDARSNQRAEIRAELARRYEARRAAATKEVIRERPIIQRQTRYYTVRPDVHLPPVLLPAPRVEISPSQVMQAQRAEIEKVNLTKYPEFY